MKITTNIKLSITEQKHSRGTEYFMTFYINDILRIDRHDIGDINL